MGSCLAIVDIRRYQPCVQVERILETVLRTLIVLHCTIREYDGGLKTKSCIFVVIMFNSFKSLASNLAGQAADMVCMVSFIELYDTINDEWIDSFTCAL